MWIRIHCNFSNPQGLIIEIKKERIKLQLSSDRNKGRFQFFREDLFIKGSGIILTLCIWWNFFARSFSLVKRELHVFMKLFFSLSSFFFCPQQKQRKKLLKLVLQKRKNITVYCARALLVLFAQRCNYYTGYNSKLTSFLSILVLNEK